MKTKLTITTNNKTSFSRLKIGALFMLNETLYVKVIEHKNEFSMLNCVDIKSGIFNYLPGRRDVEYISEAKIDING